MCKTICSFAPLALALLLSGCGGCSSQHETPEAAFTALQDAAKDEDWETAIEQMTSESQETLAGGMVFVLGMAAAFDQEHSDEIESLLKKHGLDPDAESDDGPMDGNDMAAALAKLTEPIKDKPAFIADAIALLKKMDKGGDDSSMDFAADGALEDLKIDGDSATAVIVGTRNGQEKREPIEFRKIDGGWLVHIPRDSLGGGGPSDSGNVTFSSSSNDGERMGGFDDELPVPDEVPEVQVAPADLAGLNLNVTTTVSSEEPEGMFGLFDDGTQFATLTLKGQPVVDGYEYGHVQLSATDNAGQPLELAKPLEGKFGGSLSTEFVELKHFFLDAPDELKLYMAFAPASDQTERIAKLSGTIKLKARTSVTVNDVAGKVGQTISDAALESYGEFEIVEARDGAPGETVEVVSKGPGHEHHRLVLTDTNGNVIQEHAWRNHGDDYTRYSIVNNAPLPPGTGLKIILSGSERVLIVPFEVTQ